jgi:UDP-N-acetylglucosamine transferase subunit ALG13
MIFLTVGTQLPFERLIKCVDLFCQHNHNIQVVGQISMSSYTPKNFEYHDTLSIPEFSALFEQSDLVISHAGMGSILTALCAAKPILIMPRLTKYKEHRNDHQVGTAENFSQHAGCHVFNDVDQLNNAYTAAINESQSASINSFAPDETISNLRKLIA